MKLPNTSVVSWIEIWNDAPQPLAWFHARENLKRNKRPQLSRLSPIFLNDLVLSLLALKSPFCPVLWPFCPVMCPFCPSHKSLKCAETVYDTTFIDNREGFKGIPGEKAYFRPVFFRQARVQVKRVAKQKSSHDWIQPMIYLQTIISFFRTF